MLLDRTEARTNHGSPGVLTKVSWAPRRDLALAGWVEQGRWLGALGRATGWWLGDWIRYGSARYGDRYEAAAQVTGYDTQTLMNMAYVAGRFQPTRRRERLSFSHHAELAGLPREDQELWLDRAEAGGLSVRLLRAELREVRRRVASRQAQRARVSDDAVGESVVCPQCGNLIDLAESAATPSPAAFR